MFDEKIDQDDLKKTAKAKFISTEKKGNQKFAVIIKSAKAEHPKFNITTKDDVKNAITAISVNDKLPPNLMKSASYYIKTAAEHFGIPNDIESLDPQPHTIDLKDIKFKHASKKDYILKIGEKQFELTTELQMKNAEDHFLATISKLSIPNRTKAARVISRQAIGSNFALDPVTKSYAFPKIGSGTKEQIEFRKLAFIGKHKELINKIAEIIDDCKPEVLVEKVRQLDKVANYTPKDKGFKYVDFFKESIFPEPKPKKEPTKYSKIL